VKFGPDETMTAALEFVDNILRLQISEDKHAIYPTEECGDNVTLVFNLIGEDCGAVASIGSTAIMQVNLTLT